MTVSLLPKYLPVLIIETMLGPASFRVSDFAKDGVLAA